MRFLPRTFRPFRRILIGGLTAMALLVVTGRIWLPKIGQWLLYPSVEQQADVIAILGGGNERTRYGATLFQRGLAPEVWHTGYARHKDLTLAALQQRGVPPEHLAYLPSTSTWEDGAAIVALAQERGLHRILLVTSGYHSRRSMCVLRKQLAGSDMTVYYVMPPATKDNPDTWWQHRTSREFVLSELGKLSLYWLLYGVTPWGC